jgi:hypothetical protein
MVADWSGLIITAYVGGRSIEKVARILRVERLLVRLTLEAQSMGASIARE